MKIEQLIVQQLYNTKQVGLQGIGIFRLRPDVAFPMEGDKDFTMPADAFSFEYNLKTGEDESMVDYIVQQTGKIKPLASSDLESYAILSKQFLNLGKPLLLEGVGTVLKNQRGHYEFFPGGFVNPKIDEVPKQLKERKLDEVSFESESTTNNKGRNLMIVLSILGVVIAGLALYYFLVKNKHTTEETEPVAIVDTPKTDSVPPAASSIDTAKIAAATSKKPLDSLKAAPPVPQSPAPNGSFSIVLKEYPSQAMAQKAYNKLTNYGHKLSIVKVDSVRYKLVMPLNLPLADTLRAKDSIRKFFGGKPYVQL